MTLRDIPLAAWLLLGAITLIVLPSAFVMLWVPPLFESAGNGLEMAGLRLARTESNGTVTALEVESLRLGFQGETRLGKTTVRTDLPAVQALWTLAGPLGAFGSELVGSSGQDKEKAEARDRLRETAPQRSPDVDRICTSELLVSDLTVSAPDMDLSVQALQVNPGRIALFKTGLFSDVTARQLHVRVQTDSPLAPDEITARLAQWCFPFGRLELSDGSFVRGDGAPVGFLACVLTPRTWEVMDYSASSGERSSLGNRKGPLGLKSGIFRWR